jgi:hypothetical protein
MDGLSRNKPGLRADLIPRVEALRALARDRAADARSLTLEERRAITELAEALRKLLRAAKRS